MPLLSECTTVRRAWHCAYVCVWWGWQHPHSSLQHIRASQWASWTAVAATEEAADEQAHGELCSA